MTAARRPLSPHLQVYRPQLTSVLSILHRITGVIIALGSLLIMWWVWSISGTSEQYQFAFNFFNSLIGQILLFIWSACSFYHLCNGIRHLLWDVGMGFELKQAYLTGKMVVCAAVILTLAGWLL